MEKDDLQLFEGGGAAPRVCIDHEQYPADGSGRLTDLKYKVPRGLHE